MSAENGVGQVRSVPSFEKGGLGRIFCLLLFCLFGTAGCSRPAEEPPVSEPAATLEPAPAVAQLEIRDARANLMPGMGAVYLTVENPGAAADRLVAVETPAARVAETHESVADGDVMRMVAHPEGFEIPAGGTLELAPGGKHIMLIEPAPGIGDEVALTLRFERAGPIEITVPATALGGMDHEGDHGGHEAGGRAMGDHEMGAHDAHGHAMGDHDAHDGGR